MLIDCSKSLRKEGDGCQIDNEKKRLLTSETLEADVLSEPLRVFLSVSVGFACELGDNASTRTTLTPLVFFAFGISGKLPAFFLLAITVQNDKICNSRED